LIGFSGFQLQPSELRAVAFPLPFYNAIETIQSNHSIQFIFNTPFKKKGKKRNRWIIWPALV